MSPCLASNPPSTNKHQNDLYRAQFHYHREGEIEVNADDLLVTARSESGLESLDSSVRVGLSFEYPFRVQLPGAVHHVRGLSRLLPTRSSRSRARLMSVQRPPVLPATPSHSLRLFRLSALFRNVRVLRFLRAAEVHAIRLSILHIRQRLDFAFVLRHYDYTDGQNATVTFPFVQQQGNSSCLFFM
ncbi:hypothetical protein F443_12887 [Phytophthora nicotianae P1569]|uniref:Uncharacterized protein n=1 Tax=Phytophthora nicotianae P1569 TaxID=1317065 RepID=V9EV43_PHYNI|nr:hypothetical protein F443_12887 [Phytophthora nicotianae P1569]